MPSIDWESIPFAPEFPKAYRPAIGLVGCGGITVEHLTAYRRAGLNVVALCDVRLEQARQRAQEFFPEASLYQDYRELLRHPEIEVVDVATHPQPRVEIIRQSLLAGKHVLSQKPFVTDLDIGQQLVDLAEQKQVYLAVNQNGRWAPHFRYIDQAIQLGLLGDVFAVHLGCHWDHSWVRGTEFEKIRHLILLDYAIHWFDIVGCFLKGKMPRRVFASTARAPNQDLFPNLLAQAILDYDQAQATVVFDAAVKFGQLDETYVAGTLGSIHSRGESIQSQRLEMHTPAGVWCPKLSGSWFPDGLGGTMGELLLAIEERRECSIAASNNLTSLAVCFAALASADSGMPVVPGSIRRLPE